MFKIKDIEKRIEDEVNNFVYNNYKSNALKELESISNDCPSIKFIVNQYPNFNHLRFIFSVEDKIEVNINVNPEVLKGNKKAIRVLAKTIYSIVDKNKIKRMDKSE